ncbi:MAG: DUF2909 domain-containing protein [Proteobacteria bacterium]|nr:DUF2909 domain-containing protein [Pseudomonadota bacterium]
MLKIAIVLLLLALIASLGSGFYYLMVDQGDKTKRRLLHSLGVRLGLTATLIALVVYGVATGQLGHSNPWDSGPGTADTKTQSSPE